jgi:lysyl-tRNA synthetase class II
MKTFKVNQNYQIGCEYQKTRNGFKHVAKLFRTGLSGTTTNISETKVCYLNRTWESFEYETVIEKLLQINSDLFSKQTITKFLKRQKGEYKKQFQDNCKTISAIAQIGNLLCNDQKEKNDWKKRMLLAGLPDLNIPEDWDLLSENDKENRLNMVIAELQK